VCPRGARNQQQDAPRRSGIRLTTYHARDHFTGCASGQLLRSSTNTPNSLFSRGRKQGLMRVCARLLPRFYRGDCLGGRRNRSRLLIDTGGRSRFGSSGQIGHRSHPMPDINLTLFHAATARLRHRFQVALCQDSQRFLQHAHDTSKHDHDIRPAISCAISQPSAGHHEYWIPAQISEDCRVSRPCDRGSHGLSPLRTLVVEGTPIPLVLHQTRGTTGSTLSKHRSCHQSIACARGARCLSFAIAQVVDHPTQRDISND